MASGVAQTPCSSHLGGFRMTSKSLRARRQRPLALVLVVLTATAVVLVAAAVRVSSASTATPSSTLVVSRATDPHSLDPAQEVTTGGGLETFVASYERLFNLTPKGKIVPGLAT